MNLDHRAETSLLLHTGLLNSYMAGYLLRRNLDALDEQMWDEALDDAKQASRLGVDSDQEFSQWFYIDRFADQICRGGGCKLGPDELQELKAHMFEQRQQTSYENLADFKQVAEEWMAGRDLKKAAYPNTGTNWQALPRYNEMTWGDLVDRINKSVKMGWSRREALIEAAAELKPVERLDFLAWYGLHSSGETSKYDLNDRIKHLSAEADRSAQASVEGQMGFSKLAEAADERFYYLPRFRNQTPPEFVRPQPTPPTTPADRAEDPKPAANQHVEQNAKDFESARQKLVSRTFSIDKLLEKYKAVLKTEQVDGIEDSLNELRKKIRKLKMAASIRDSLVKTAGICESLDFLEGARELLVLAADEQVLKTDSQEQMPAQKRNELISAVVQKLNEVVNALKARDLIRSISEVDIMLDQLSMASFFPEMQEAQAKLIEAFGYAGNRIEDIVPKLRGALPNPADPTAQLSVPVSKTDDPLAQLQQMADQAKQTGVVSPPPPTTTELKEKAKEDKERAKLLQPKEPAAPEAAAPPAAPKTPVQEPLPEPEEAEGLKPLNLPVRRRPAA